MQRYYNVGKSAGSKGMDLKSRSSQKTLNKQIAEDVFSLSHITSSPPSKKSKKNEK